MKKINYVKIILDVIMVFIFALLFNKMVLGMLFHEVAGLAIGAVILVHCALNWKWIKGVTLKFFNKGIPVKTRIGYIIDVLLLINVVVIIVTGIFISKILFAGLNLSSAHTFKFLHIASSYFSLMLIGIHLGLHWNWVMAMVRKIFKLPQKKSFSYLSKVMVIFMLAFGIYTMNSVGYFSRISLFGSPNVESKIKAEARQKDEGNITKPAEGKLSGNQQKVKDGPGGNTDVLKVIASQLGIISVFTIGVFYIEKTLVKRKIKNIKIIN